MTTASNPAPSPTSPASVGSLPSSPSSSQETARTSDPPHPFAVLPRRVPASTSTTTVDCPIDEIIQYQCQMHRSEVVCVPLVRLFRRCPGAPAVEITPEYDRLGRPVVPPMRSPFIDPDATEVKHRSPMFHKVSQTEAQAREQASAKDESRTTGSGVRWGGSRASHDDNDDEHH